MKKLIFFVIFSTGLWASNPSLNINYKNCSEQLIKRAIKKSINLRQDSQKDSASHYLNKALVCSQRISRKDLEAEAFLELGVLEYRLGGTLDSSTQYFLKSLALYSDLNDIAGISRCNLQLGVLNYEIKNYPAALEYFKAILAADSTNKNMSSLAYYLLALSFSELRKFDQATEMFDSAKAFGEANDSIFQLQVTSFKGKMYANKGNYRKAVEILELGKLRYSNVIQKDGFAPIYAFLANAYLQLNNYRKAISQGKLAYRLSKKSTASTIYLKEAQETLQKAYFAIGNIDSAYFFLTALSALKDSVSNESVLQRIAEMNGQFKFEQRLKLERAKQELRDQIARQEIERQKFQRNLFLLGLVLAAVFAFVFLRQRLRISKERDRSESLLLNILPAAIAQELKNNGSAKAQNHQNVSILFSDFKGFTEKSAQLSAADLVSEIDTCFKGFDQIMDKYKIEKIKTIGDSYMAAGGLPEPSVQSVKNTVLAAIEMQTFLHARYKSQAASTKLSGFEMRIGIHTGPVVAGVVGQKKFQYDIWGDTVNTASRMESHGVVGEINISENTYLLLKHEPDLGFKSRGEIVVKGKGAMKMFFVTAK